MSTIHVNFEYCYGIKKLECDFKFNNGVDVIAVYASNGIMKSSFAKTFRDLQNGDDTIDQIYPDENSLREIKRTKNNDKENMAQDEVYVVTPFENEYDQDSVSTILAEPKKRKEYEDAHKKIKESKKKFINILAQYSSYSHKNTELKIKTAFGIEDFYHVLDLVKNEVSDSNTALSEISHKIIFDEKVQSFLKTKKVRQYILEYFEKYNSILKNSKYLKKEFDYHDAILVNENLHNTGFFNAKHSINLFDGKNKQSVDDTEAFDNVLNEELKPLFDSENNKNVWTNMDKEASANIPLQNFKSHVEKHPEIKIKLANMEKFSKDIWISYFSKHKVFFDDLLVEYTSNIDKINKIIDAVNAEENSWHEIIKTYNDRFYVPFKVSITNQSDVILKNEAPFIEFIHNDRNGNRSKSINKNELLKNLSTGEKKALYILDILYDIEARKKNSKYTLLVIDDIVDSFDYKNKYTIIQYLEEISHHPSFNMIILTHNFDFFRTIADRGIVRYDDCFFARNDEKLIKLDKINGMLNNVFINWRNNLGNRANIIVLIPFLRNIIQYTIGTDCSDYGDLSTLLHYRDSNTMSFNDLKKIYEKYFKKPLSKFQSSDKKVIDAIFSESDNCSIENNGINFEHKIILSIAIRLLAEKYIQIKDISNKLDTIKNDVPVPKELGKIIEEYAEKYSDDKSGIRILKKINLMTPMNIHLNSFMYEPIIDMSHNELIDLYKEIREFMS